NSRSVAPVYNKRHLSPVHKGKNTVPWPPEAKVRRLHRPGLSCPFSPAKEIAMRVVKAAAVQLSPVLYNREGTVEKVVRTIHELGQRGVQFATFPETVVPYYPYFSFVQSPYQTIVGPEHRKLLDQAVTVPSPATSAISEACKQAGVVVSIGV